jgi:hypothetical protein
VVGILLLIPPSRAVVRSLLARRFRARLEAVTTTGFRGPGGSFAYGRVYDVENVGDVTPPGWRDGGKPPHGELGSS